MKFLVRKATIVLFAITSFTAFAEDDASPATDYSICQEAHRFCEKPATCEEFDSCQRKALKDLNALILNTLDTLESPDDLHSCIEKRNGLENDIWARSTTIECVNTPDGPHFGG